MPVVASAAPQRPIVPAGQYPARCIDVYSAGWWPKMDDPSQHVEKVKVVFAALVGAAEEYDDEGNLLPADASVKPEVRYVDLFESLTLGKKANLKKFLEQWRGKPFTDEQIRGFDLETLLAVPALVSVVHKRKQDGTARAIISAIMPLPGSMRKLAPQAPADYVMDRDRDKPFASERPNPATKAGAAKGGDGFEDFPGALEDDDSIPF